MTDGFIKFLSENNIFSTDDKVLLAVSGGIDSMVMASLFLKHSFVSGIAHCNFMLREADSEKDEEIVRRFASENNVPFFCKKFDTRAFALENSLSIQMAARELRYKWFEEIREENGYDYIAIAHNLNDNIETLLINLTRGTGIAGMSGMKPCVNHIIRPLLYATRKDIEAYRDHFNIEFREDKSNADTKYIRNKIRHLVVPLLKEINPSIETTLNETAGRFSELNEIVSAYIRRLHERISEEKDDLIRINVNQLKTHLHNKTVIYELFKPYGITGAVLTDLIKIIEGKTGGRIITDTHRIIKDRNEIIVSAAMVSDEVSYKIDRMEDLSTFPGISSARGVRITDTFEIPDEPYMACLDFQKVSFPVLIRKWKPGDYFFPLGMSQKKKLSNYFIDNKYSRFDKENIYIMESDGQIAWIIGDRIDDRFKITELTRKGLLIKSKRKAMIIKPVK